MKERASGADRWRLCNVVEWKRQELSESGNLPAAVCNFENEGTVSLAHVAVAKVRSLTARSAFA